MSKSGSNGFHGTAYEFVRNAHFDATNFFDPPGKIAPFKRNIFGYSVGGPIIKNKTFFFHSYEGRRGREVATINTVVPTPDQRAAVTNPVITKLLAIVPAANDATGTHFVGSAARQRTLNQETGRTYPNFNEEFPLGSFIINRDERTEPTLQNNNLPGFGDAFPPSATSSHSAKTTSSPRSPMTSMPASIARPASTSSRPSTATPPISEWPRPPA